MFLEVKTIEFCLSELIVVVVECFLSQTNYLSCTVQSVKSFAVGVYGLVEFSPIINIIHGLSDGSFLDFTFGLGSIGDLSCLGLLVLSGYATVSNFDGAVEEEFVFEIDDLFEGEETHVDVDFAGKIEVEEIAVVKVEAWMRKGVTGAADGEDGL